MHKHWFRWIMVFFSFCVAVNGFYSVHASGPTLATKEEGDVTTVCLQCHGPFEKLASEPPNFTAPSGEKITPHRYVPHDLKEIPDCLNCHHKHSENPTPAEIAALPKPNVKFCFECHHKENFTRCKDCHKPEGQRQGIDP